MWAQLIWNIAILYATFYIKIFGCIPANDSLSWYATRLRYGKPPKVK